MIRPLTSRRSATSIRRTLSTLICNGNCWHLLSNNWKAYTSRLPSKQQVGGTGKRSFNDRSPLTDVAAVRDRGRATLYVARYRLSVSIRAPTVYSLTWIQESNRKRKVIRIPFIVTPAMAETAEETVVIPICPILMICRIPPKNRQNKGTRISQWCGARAQFYE